MTECFRTENKKFIIFESLIKGFIKLDVFFFYLILKKSVLMSIYEIISF